MVGFGMNKKPEDNVTVGIGTNRMILAHQLVDMIETKQAYTEKEALVMLSQIYGVLILITGRQTMAEKHPELVDKVVGFENPKLDIE
jgi:hypothetical protein